MQQIYKIAERNYSHLINVEPKRNIWKTSAINSAKATTNRTSSIYIQMEIQLINESVHNVAIPRFKKINK